MSLEEDRAVQAARDTVVQEFAEGYKVLGGPESSVPHQHDIDRIPREDVTHAVQIGGSGWLRTGQRDDRLAVFSMEA